MNNFSITKCVSDAWDLSVKHWYMCFVVVVAVILSQLISGIGAPSVAITPDMAPEEIVEAYTAMFTGTFIATGLISIVVTYAIYAGMTKMAINGYNGEKVDTNAFKMPAGTYVKFVVGQLAFGILAWVGFLLCVIPGIIVMVRFVFAPIILIDEPETDIIEAFKKSWNMTSGNFWTLFGLGLMGILIYLVGIVCCCVGAFFSAVIMMFMEIIAYYYFKGNNSIDVVSE